MVTNNIWNLHVHSPYLEVILRLLSYPIISNIVEGDPLVSQLTLENNNDSPVIEVITWRVGKNTNSIIKIENDIFDNKSERIV